MRKSAIWLALLLLSLVLPFLSTPLAGATEDSWVTKESMPTARSGLGVATVNGKIYAIGGSDESGFAPSIPGSAALRNVNVLGTNEEYDPRTDAWTIKSSMPTPRIEFAITVYKNKIYCIGGSTSQGSTGTNEVYDPLTDTWETKASMPTARSWLTANVVNDEIYLLGGYPNSTLNEVYDPISNIWTTKTPSPMPAAFTGGTASAVFENKIYVIGGLSQDQHYNLNQIYDVGTDSWSNGSSPTSSVDGGAAVTTTGEFAPEQIYVLGSPGSLRQGEEQTFVRAYNTRTYTWKYGADVPTRRYNAGVTVLNDTIYVIGGHTYAFPGHFGPSAANEQYIPIEYIPEFPSWIILPLFLGFTFVIMVIKKKNGFEAIK